MRCQPVAHQFVALAPGVPSVMGKALKNVQNAEEREKSKHGGKLILKLGGGKLVKNAMAKEPYPAAIIVEMG